MTTGSSCREIKLKIETKDIYYVTWILDASEGIGFLETDDAAKGLVTVIVPESQTEYFYDLIERLINDEQLKVEILDE